MGTPLGIIKDPNPNRNAEDVYSLIINNIVVNTILASYNDILHIAANYDYCVDITMNGSLNYGIGNTYIPSNDDFYIPPPPPIDWPESVQLDFDNILLVIQQAVNDCGPGGGNMTIQQVNASYNSALNDNPNLDQATLTLFETIYNYVIASLS